MVEKTKAVPVAPLGVMPVERPTTLMQSLLAHMEADADDADDIAIVGTLAPGSAPATPFRSPRSAPVTNLDGLSKLWELIGEGGAGKTTLARYIIDQAAAHDVLGRMAVATLAPGNRNLEQLVTTLQPPSTDPRETAAYTLKVMAGMARARLNGVFDYGGGDASHAHMLTAEPGLVDMMEAQGLAIIAAYVLTPRSADLTYLKTYEAQGFKPRATALVLNMARAETPSAFDGLRRQPEYKAALDRGAVEVIMPALPQTVALRIERAGVGFTEARDGLTGANGRMANINAIERVMVREWLDRMKVELSAVEGWMPWS